MLLLRSGRIDLKIDLTLPQPTLQADVTFFIW